MRVNLQPSFILHTRPFRDTSLLIELFTLDYGRISVLARNARGTRSRFKGILQPFLPFIASWAGKTDLMSLNQIELNGQPYYLTGKTLVCGLYLNELLMRLLPKEDAHPSLFHAYQAALAGLQSDHPERTLRLFEKELLMDLGYGIELIKDIHGNFIQPDGQYHWQPEKGFVPIFNPGSEPIFNGNNLLALQQNNLQSMEDLQTAKKLTRLLLQPLLGHQPIRSRELL